MNRNRQITYRRSLQRVLRDARIAAGLRQEEVARQLNQSQSFVSKYESGERRLDLAELRDICEVLKISLEDLIREIEDSDK
jgi:transcriptional regulator with XRE-family HTH domain